MALSDGGAPVRPLVRRLRTLATHVGRHGVLAGVRLLLGRSLAQLDVVHIGVCYALEDFSRAAAPLPDVAALELRQLDEREIRRLTAAGESWFFPGAVEASLARGDFCFGAFVDGMLVASGWYATVPIRQFGAVIGFRERGVWEHRLYTKPEFRGRGINAAIKIPAMRALAERGYDTLINSIEWTNDASRRLHERVGYEAIAAIVRIGSERVGITRLYGGSRQDLHIVR